MTAWRGWKRHFGRGFGRGLCALAAVAGLGLPPASARTPRPAAPALWQVRDADTTIYLFGTIHALKGEADWMKPAIIDAFDRSEELVTELGELDQAEAAATTIQMAVDPDGPPLSTRLSPKARERYLKAMQDAGLPAAQFESFEPWYTGVVLSMAPMMKQGFNKDSGVEAILTARAKTQGKPQRGLETIEEQLSFFDTLPEEDQIAFLNGAVENGDEAVTQLDALVRHWRDGDVQRLERLVNSGFRDSEKLRSVLLADRNARWADWIAKRMEQPGTVFMAVGAGHLAGKDSVQAMLGKHGLTATRMPTATPIANAD